MEFTGTPSPTAFSRACERIQPLAVVAPGALPSAENRQGSGVERCPLRAGRRERSGKVDRPASVLAGACRGSRRDLPVRAGTRACAGRVAGRSTTGGYRHRTTRRGPPGVRRAAPPCAQGADGPRHGTRPDPRRCAKNPAVDAVFAYNDELALIVLQLLRGCGHQSPGRHRGDGLRQPPLCRADAAISDHDGLRRRRGPVRRLPPRHARGPSAAASGRWACRLSSLENRLRTVGVSGVVMPVRSGQTDR